MSEQEKKPDTQPEEPKNIVHRLYDKIPLNLRQVDLLIKLLFVLLVVVLIAGIVSANR